MSAGGAGSHFCQLCLPGMGIGGSWDMLTFSFCRFTGLSLTLLTFFFFFFYFRALPVLVDSDEVKYFYLCLGAIIFTK